MNLDSLIPVDSFPSWQDRLYREQLQIQENMLKEVLSKHLGREAEMEDFKKCKMIYYRDIFDRYQFLYDKTLLGEISYGMKGLFAFQVTFIPQK